MEILAQIDTSREGNDCWIYEGWILVDIFDQRILFHNQKSTGYFGEDFRCTEYSLDELSRYPEADKMYNLLQEKYLNS